MDKVGVALVVGGTSGLGYALANRLAENHQQVIIAGRQQPQKSPFDYLRLDLAESNFEKNLERIVSKLPKIRTLAIAAGYYQEGRLGKLSSDEIVRMITVGLVAPTLLINELLRRQAIETLVVITSTSQTTPRLMEPVYTAIKAGMAMLANSLAEEPKVARVLVAAPAGMSTPFWKNAPRPAGTNMLTPEWVADQVIQEMLLTEHFREVKILREPPRVELVSERTHPTDATYKILSNSS